MHVSKKNTKTWSEGFDLFLADNQRRHDTRGEEMSGYRLDGYKKLVEGRVRPRLGHFKMTDKDTRVRCQDYIY